jgi:hypothetical protein
MIQQAEILEHDSDLAAQRHDAVTVELVDLLPEHGQLAAGGAHAQIKQTQQRRFTRAGRTRQEMERPGRQGEGEVVEDLGAGAE